MAYPHRCVANVYSWDRFRATHACFIPAGWPDLYYIQLNTIRRAQFSPQLLLFSAKSAPGYGQDLHHTPRSWGDKWAHSGDRAQPTGLVAIFTPRRRSPRPTRPCSGSFAWFLAWSLAELAKIRQDMVRICAKYPKYGPKATTGVTYVHYVPVWVPWFIGFAFFWAFFGLFSLKNGPFWTWKFFKSLKLVFCQNLKFFRDF